MKHVIFENDGELDVRGIKTFGISAKENKNPIGYFGTGLKYAIAIALRNNHKIGIHSGKTFYDFSTSKNSMRGVEFTSIMMHAVDLAGAISQEELAFTTDLGKNWKIWQAFREVYCNCIDEGGNVYLSDKIPEPTQGKTFVFLTGKEFVEQFYARHELVMEPDTNMVALENSYLTVYDKPSTHVFYRCVRVGELKPKGIYTYNFTNGVDLTEDRTMLYQSFELARIGRVVMGATDKEHIRKMLLAPSDSLEASFRYDGVMGVNPTTEFLTTLEHLYKTNSDELNESAREFHRKIAKQETTKNLVEIELNPVEKKQLQKATQICVKVFPNFKDYEVFCVEHLGISTMAMADTPRKRMIISRRCFEFGTKFLMSTLIEEYMHLKTGYSDHTRELQTYLFDTICTLIENHVLKEPI